MIPFDPSILQWADMLLYFEEDVVDLVIAEKTGKRVGHVERYVGAGRSWASRNGVGVNIYPLRLDGLVCVRRPIGVLDSAKATDWFKNVAMGQKYDFKGLLAFTSFVKSGTPGDMFCSEFSVNLDRAAGFDPLNPSQAAVDTSPRDLWILPTYETIWRASDEY